MRALIKGPRGPSLSSPPAPRVQAEDDVIVEVAHVGICRTDVYAARGQLSIAAEVLGHEASGVVAEVGSGASVSPGTRVAVMPWLHCGDCSACAAGTPQRCLHAAMLGVDRNGAFADAVCVPARCVHPIPEKLSLREAAYAEPLCAAMAVLDLDLPRTGRGVVVGGGRIAELTARVLRAAGFDRLDSCEAGGASTGYDFAIETRAEPDTLAAAIDSIRPGGTLVVKSRPPNPVMVPLARIAQRELVLRGAHYGRFEDALAWLARPPRGFDVHDLLGASYRLEDFRDALTDAEGERTKCFFQLSEAH